MSLPCKGRGGWRPGAGRPGGSKATHHGREALQARFPVHLVWRTAEGVPSLRRNAVYPRVVGAVRGMSEGNGFRFVYASILGNHMHLLAECESAEALGRAMLALGTSIAMRVNRATGHRGAVFADRYFVRDLRTPTEVARAISYVRGNEEHHGMEARPQIQLAEPATWLLRDGWRRGRAMFEREIDLGRPRPGGEPVMSDKDRHRALPLLKSGLQPRGRAPS